MNLWNEVKKLEGKKLRTLNQKKQFAVSEVLGDRVIMVTSKGNKRKIRWIAIQRSWDYQKAQGALTREILLSCSRYNSPYVATILANLP